MSRKSTDTTQTATKPLSTPAPASKTTTDDGQYPRHSVQCTMDQNLTVPLAASFTSETSTLNEGTKDETTKNEGTNLGASSTAFAKKAKKEGWAAPTATRPSFGWYVLYRTVQGNV